MALLLAIPLTASATTLQIDAKVTRTLAADEAKFGGCMAWLNMSPATEGLDCNTGNWVTFSCSGEHLSKSSWCALAPFGGSTSAATGCGIPRRCKTIVRSPT